MEQNIIPFLRELKYSFSEAQKVYTHGSCFRLFKIIQTIYPYANPMYSETDGHWVTEINGRYYDINGEINPAYIEDKKYEVVINPTVIASAYIPTYNGQITSYNKYLKTL